MVYIYSIFDIQALSLLVGNVGRPVDDSLVVLLEGYYVNDQFDETHTQSLQNPSSFLIASCALTSICRPICMLNVVNSDGVVSLFHVSTY